MLSYDEALQRILKETPPPRTALVRLDEALGLVLAQPVIAGCDLPQCDNSAVDGYALRASEGVGTLRVVGQSSAGAPYRGLLRQGEAVRIFTGAVVPRGAEGIVMQEHVEQDGRCIRLERPPAAGRHIRRRGDDVHRGAQVLEAGTPLRPQEIGLLAALGLSRVRVYRRPVVAVICTGDELRQPGAALKPGQIYESNGVLLTALARQAGATVGYRNVIRDALQPLSAAMRRGLAAADLLLVSGGVSVGEKDFVREAARACGIRERFWKVNIKPGMPLFFGRHQRTVVFGLPGNPVSVFATFEEFVKPAIHHLMGRPWHDGYTTAATLAEALNVSQTRRTHFIRVRCVAQNAHLLVHPLDGQGSHHLHSLVRAHGWIRMTADEAPWPAGTPVLVKREETRWSGS